MCCFCFILIQSWIIIEDFEVYKETELNCNCGSPAVFRCFPGTADTAIPGPVSDFSGRHTGPKGGDHEPADLQAASLRHHQCPGRHQTHQEGISQQDQVDVSEQMK